jgi:hypothetical protein
VLVAGAAFTFSLASAQSCLVDTGAATANEPVVWDGAVCVDGTADEERLQRHYQVRVTTDARRLELRAASSRPDRLDLCLEHLGERHCRDGEGSVSLPDLVLPAGEYRVRFDGRFAIGDTYRLELVDQGPAREGFEREPNDSVAHATLLGDDLAVRGRLEGRERDYFRVDVTGEPQLWRLQVVGGDVAVLRYHDAAGGTVQERRIVSGDRGIRMSNLFLMPGPHYFSLDGTDADYALRLIPLGPADEPPADAATPGAASPEVPVAGRLGPPMTPAPPPAADDMIVPVPTGPRPPGRMEREPNDDPSRAHLLRPEEPWVGLLVDPGDVDVYRFHLGDEGYVRLTVTPPDGGAVEANASGSWSGPGVGEPYVYEAWHLAGDHVVSLRPAVLSDGYYQVLLELLDPFDLPDDLEPNDDIHQARPLPADLEVRGRVGTHRDSDWYLLGEFAVDTEVIAELVGEDARMGSVRSVDTGALVDSFRVDRDTGLHHAALPAGGPYAVSIAGEGGYHLRLAFDPGPAPAPRPAPPPVRVDVVAETSTVAAYHHVAQRLPVRVELRNDGDGPVDLQLDTHVSDHTYVAALEATEVSLAAGEAASVTLMLTVMPGARDDLGATVTVAARDEDGGVVTGALALAAVCGAPAADPRQVWPVPAPLLGGLNVAWTGLGAEPLTERRREFMLYDGLTPPGDGFNASFGDSTTVRLAGDEAPRVLGVLLHPLGAGETGTKLADFRVSTSLDGETFTPVLEGRLRSVVTEQGFVFDEGVVARYLRLEFLARQDGAARNPVNLGQLKVIAEPTGSPFAAPIDLAQRAVGGHVARSEPHLPLYALTDTPGNRPLTRRLDIGRDSASFVIGFHHNRAALIDALEWEPHPDGSPEQRFTQVEVSVSTGDALGPWQPLGTWAPHERPTWRLDEPVWARFVRFEATDLEPRSTVEYPAALRVLEHSVGSEYRSILGEWGHYAQAAALEWRHPPTADASGSVSSGNDTRDRAHPLASGDAVEGRVLVGEYEAWYRIDVPEGHNHVRLELRGDPTVAYGYELRDAAGDPVDADVSAGSELVTIRAYAAPGSYYLRTWEPPRSVVFAWDNSGSMGPYIEATYQTVFGFARDVSPAREQVQLLAFALTPRFIMDGWTGDPATLLRELLAYDRSDASSDAEANFAYAVEELAGRDGTRAVLLVTDAESGASADATVALWRALETARPRVFTFETSTSGSDDTQDRMQTWALGGFYDYSRTIGDLEVGFARASCLLRQPKAVRVALTTADVPPPGPGTLVVRRLADGAVDEAAVAAVHVIFDASGSMGKLLPDGSASRLAVARAVLTDIVEQVLEGGTPFALRAYGHVMPTSCDTSLEYPLAPLDRAAARRAIEGIEPKLLSGTPLAASIAMVADDLAAATGPKTVVLITDGEESCGGDPEAAIRHLMAAGIDVQLSIVGFDLDADDTAAAYRRFETWAALGGGRVFDTASGSELREALLAALTRETAYEVLDSGGAVVATGVLDGDGIELPTGAYRVRVLSVPEVLLDDVRIRPDARTSVTLEGE